MPQNRSENLAVVVPFDGRPVSSRRRSFERQIELDLAMARQAGRRLSVFCIRVSSDAGHSGEAGHEALNKLFRTLQEHVRHHPSSRDQVGWSWSDGLAIAHFRTQDAFGVYQYARRLLKLFLHRGKMKSPFDVNLGIAVYPVDGNRASSLLDHAYAAAKRAGHWESSGFCFFSRSMGKEVADQLTMDVSLLRELKAGSFEMQYQPIQDLRHSCLIGVGAMPAWCHPTLGLQAADEIMKAVERAKIAGAFNAWLTDQICVQSRHWRQTHRRRRIGIKATRSQLVDSDLAARLSKVLGEHDNPADLIEVAIDGALLVDGTDHRLRTGLNQLADLGVQLTVANTGAQPLPLEALATLPVKAIEFAPEMVSPIGRCLASERTLAALVSLFSELGLKTRATAVGSKTQLDFLIANDCDEATGPHLAMPMFRDDVDRLTTIRPCTHLSNQKDVSDGQHQQMG